jgi:hypothetical protein
VSGQRPGNAVLMTAYDSRHNVFLIGMEGMGTHFAYRYKYQDVGAQDAARGPDAGRVTVYPNPFNAAVVISIDDGHVGATRRVAPTLAIYDINGRMVCCTVPPASGKYTWNAAAHPAGIYLLKAKIGKKTWLKKLVLVK